MTSVAILGTGLLGTAIATRLLEQGLNVRVWNRDVSRIIPLVRKGATAIDDIGQVGVDNKVLITVLSDGAATTSVIRAVGKMKGSTVIPMGTMGVVESRKLSLHVTQPVPPNNSLPVESHVMTACGFPPHPWWKAASCHYM